MKKVSFCKWGVAGGRGAKKHRFFWAGGCDRLYFSPFSSQNFIFIKKLIFYIDIIIYFHITIE
jgi:hypothetical protein